MNIEAIRELIPGHIRQWMYAIWVLATLLVGAISAWTDGNLEWIPAADRTLQYLMVPLGLLAAVNVTTPAGDMYRLSADLANGYVGRHAKQDIET